MLHRRLISKELQKLGWSVKTTVDGWVDVQVPPRHTSADAFAKEVRTAVEGLGYAPTVALGANAHVVRIRTAETLDQAGRGEHGFVSSATPVRSASRPGVIASQPSTPLEHSPEAPTKGTPMNSEAVPRWVSALNPVVNARLEVLSRHSPFQVWHIQVAFAPLPLTEWPDRWKDTAVMDADTWRKRPIVRGTASGAAWSCGEIELVARLRGAGMEAYWISEWSGFAPVREWEGYCVTRARLRDSLPEVWEQDRRVRAADPSLGARGGHPDIAAWGAEDGILFYAEYKGPGDAINLKQDAWARAMYRSGQNASYVAVKGVIVES